MPRETTRIDAKTALITGGSRGSAARSRSSWPGEGGGSSPTAATSGRSRRRSARSMPTRSWQLTVT